MPKRTKAAATGEAPDYRGEPTAVDLDTRVQPDEGGLNQHLNRRTLLAAAVGIGFAQFVVAVPAVLNGLWQQDLGTSSAQLLWVAAAFQLPVTILELTFGVLGDMFGRKRLLVGGAVLAAIGMAVALFTPGPGTATGTRLAVMWTGQALAGIGVAAIIPTTLAMVAAGTRTARERARGLTTWSVALAVGAAGGPLISGLAATHPFGTDPNSGWRWVFLVGIVIALISVGLSLGATGSADPVGRSLDWPGQVTVALGLCGLLFAVIQGSSSGWGSWQAVGGFLAAVVFLGAFVALELRSAAPLLQLRLFAHRPFAAATAANLLGMFAFLGTGYSTSIRLSAIQGFSPLRVGLAVVLENGVGLLFFPVVRKLLGSRTHPRRILLAGLALMAVANFWLAAVPITHMSIDFLVLAPLVLTGAGFALTVNSVAAVTVNTVPRHTIGMASGANGMFRDLGFMLAPSVLGAIALSHAASRMSAAVSASPALQKAVGTFYSLPATVPAAHRASIGAAVGAVKSGPLGAVAIPATVPGAHGTPTPFNPLHETALLALGSSYSLSYILSGLAAMVAIVLVAVVVRGQAAEETNAAETHVR